MKSSSRKGYDDDDGYSFTQLWERVVENNFIQFNLLKFKIDSFLEFWHLLIRKDFYGNFERIYTKGDKSVKDFSKINEKFNC